MLDSMRLECPVHGYAEPYTAPVGYVPEKACTCPVTYVRGPVEASESLTEAESPTDYLLVLKDGYDVYTPKGVFSTRELAEKAQSLEPHPSNEYDPDYYDIEELTLNEFASGD